MQTKHIGSGAVVGAQVAVSQSSSNDGLSDKFSAVLKGLLGGEDAQQMAGNIKDLQAMQLAVSQSAKSEELKAAAQEVRKEVPVETPQKDENDEQEMEQDVKQSSEPMTAKTEDQAPAIPLQTQNAEVPQKEEDPAADLQSGLSAKNEQGSTAQTAVKQQGNGSQPAEQAKAEVKSAEAQAPGQPTSTAAQQQQQQPQGEQIEKSAKTNTAEKTQSYQSIQVTQVEQGSETQEAAQPNVKAQGPDAAVAPKADTRKEVAAAMLQGMASREAATATQSSATASAAKPQVANAALEIGSMNNQNTAEKTLAAKVRSSAPVSKDSEHEKIVEQVKEMLKKAIQNRDSNSITVKLNPPELGEMTVKVTQRDKQIYARITPESADVEKLLRERSGDVTQVLVAAGLKPEHVHVSIGREFSDSEVFDFNQFQGQQQPGMENKGSDAGQSGGSGLQGGLDWQGFRQSSQVVDSGWVA